MAKIVEASIRRAGTVVWSKYEATSSFFEKFKGIMLRKSIDFPLLFTFTSPGKWSIHSCFCLFDFDAVFLDENKKVVTIARGVKPWTLSVTPSECLYLIECTAGDANKLQVGDVLEW